MNELSKQHPKFTYGFVVVSMTFFWIIIVLFAIAFIASVGNNNSAAITLFLLLVFLSAIQSALNKWKIGCKRNMQGNTSEEKDEPCVGAVADQDESGTEGSIVKTSTTWTRHKFILKALAVILVLILGLTARNQYQKQATQNSKKPDTKQSSKQEAPQESVDYISKFIDKYNASAQTPIEKGEQFDPHDNEGDHYRREFRLSAFDGSVGMAAKCGDLSVDIINYGGYGGFNKQNKSLRVYAFGPKEQIAQFFRAAAPILDSKVSQDDVIEASTEFDSSGYPGHINNSSITSYINGGKLAETMLDINECVSNK